MTIIRGNTNDVTRNLGEIFSPSYRDENKLVGN